jgi:iron(III) transport system substrate-binding protein
MGNAMTHFIDPNRRALLIGAAMLVLAGAPSAARAADTADLEAAKAEGKVSWYTSTPIETAQKLAKMFEDRTGVQVELFRSGGSAILRRFLQETQAGRIATDVLTTSDPAASHSLARKGVFVPFKPKNFDKIPDEAKDPNGAYIAQRINILAIFARGDKVAPADRPKTWSDLADPKYKSKMVMPDPSFTALQLMVVGTLSKKLGWDFYEKLRKNDIMIVQGHQQVSDMLKRGERVIAAEGDNSYAADARKEGHDIVTIFPTEGAILVPSPTAIVKGSPHPNAAKLFAEFMISDDAQKVFPEMGGYAARVDIPPPEGNPALKDIKLIPVDYADIEKQTADIKNHFNEIFQ